MISPRLSFRQSLLSSPPSESAHVPLNLYLAEAYQINETLQSLPPSTVLFWIQTPTLEPTCGITVSIKYYSLITNHLILKDDVTTSLTKSRSSKVLPFIHSQVNSITINNIRTHLSHYNLYQQFIKVLIRTPYFSDSPSTENIPSIHPNLKSPQLIFLHVSGLKTVELDEENGQLIFYNENRRAVAKEECVGDATRTLSKYLHIKQSLSPHRTQKTDAIATPLGDGALQINAFLCEEGFSATQAMKRLDEFIRMLCITNDTSVAESLCLLLTKLFAVDKSKQIVVSQKVVDHFFNHPTCKGIFHLINYLITTNRSLFIQCLQQIESSGKWKISTLLSQQLQQIQEDLYGDYHVNKVPALSIKIIQIKDSDEVPTREQKERAKVAKASKRKSIFFTGSMIQEDNKFVRRQSRTFQRALTPRLSAKTKSFEDATSKIEMKTEAKRLGQAFFNEILPYILRVDSTGVKIIHKEVKKENVESIPTKQCFLHLEFVLRLLEEVIVSDPTVELMSECCHIALTSAALGYVDVCDKVLLSMRQYNNRMAATRQQNLFLSTILQWEATANENKPLGYTFYHSLLVFMKRLFTTCELQSFPFKEIENFLNPIITILRTPAKEMYFDSLSSLYGHLTQTISLLPTRYFTSKQVIKFIETIYAPDETAKLSLECSKQFLLDWDKDGTNYFKHNTEILSKNRTSTITYFETLVDLLKVFEQKELPLNNNYISVHSLFEALVVPPTGYLFRFMREDSDVIEIDSKVAVLSFFTHFFSLNTQIIRRKTVINEYIRYAFSYFIKIYYKDSWTNDDIRVLLGALKMLNGLAQHKTEHSRQTFFRLGLQSLLLHEVMLEFNVSWNAQDKNEEDMFKLFKESMTSTSLADKQPKRIPGRKILKSNIPRLSVSGSPNKSLSPRKSFTSMKNNDSQRVTVSDLGPNSPKISETKITEISPRIMVESKRQCNSPLHYDTKLHPSNSLDHSIESKGTDENQTPRSSPTFPEKVLQVNDIVIESITPDPHNSYKNATRHKIQNNRGISLSELPTDKPSTTPPQNTSNPQTRVSSLSNISESDSENVPSSTVTPNKSPSLDSCNDKSLQINSLSPLPTLNVKQLDETPKDSESPTPILLKENSKIITKQTTKKRVVGKRKNATTIKIYNISNSSGNSSDNESGLLTMVEKKFKETGKLHLVMDKMMLEGKKTDAQPDLNSYDAKRKVRRIYMNEKIHEEVILLLLNLIVLENGVLDPLYTDQFPDLKGMKDVLFILSSHLDHPSNQIIAKSIFCRETINPGIRMLLKLLSSQFYDTTKYSIMKIIGEGAYGVYNVVIKQIKISESPKARSVLHDICNEILILEKHSHDHRVSHMFEYGFSGQFYNIVMYRYSQSLGCWRRKLPPSTTSTRSRLLLNVYKEVLRVCQVLNQRIIHFDIKCENFLIEPLPGVSIETVNNPPTEMPPFTLCLADFGEACLYRNEREATTTRHRGTEAIKPPEMLGMDLNKAVKVSTSSDIWALGCLFYELYTSKMLFATADVGEFYFRLLKSVELLTDSNRELLGNNERLIQFIEYVLQRDPSKRPNLSDLVQKYETVLESFSKEGKKDIAKSKKWNKARLTTIRKEYEREKDVDVEMFTQLRVENDLVINKCFCYQSTIYFSGEMVENDVLDIGITHIMHFGKELTSQQFVAILNYAPPKTAEELVDLFPKMVEVLRDLSLTHKKVLICGGNGYWPVAFLLMYTMQQHCMSSFESYVYLQRICPFIRIHATVMSTLHYFERNTLTSVFSSADKTRHFHCLCGYADIMLSEPIESSQIQNCNCEAHSKQSCPNKHQGCGEFLKKMNTKYGYEKKYIIWAGTKQKRVIGFKDTISRCNVVEVSPLKKSSSISIKSYACKKCGFLVCAIPKKGKEKTFSINNKSYDIFVVTNFPGIDLH
ncbi:Protein kinase domain-containing protein [Entamoeba marina]